MTHGYTTTAFPTKGASMKRVYVAIAAVALSLGGASEAFAAISLSTAMSVCANHGGFGSFGGGPKSGCTWCTTQGKKLCTYVVCANGACEI